MAKNSVPSKIYSKEYYLTINDGGALTAQDNALSPRLEYTLDRAQMKRGDIVLDIGCGSGELSFNAAKRVKRVIGIDYSSDAIQMCKRKQRTAPYGKRITFFRMDATRISTLDVKKGSVNVVFMTDVVEHLYPAQLEKMLRGLRPLLAPDARLIIHTAPNLEFYRYGYPLIRMAYPLLRRIRPLRDLLWTKPNWKGRYRLPKDPEKGSHNKMGHVNEQTPATLRKTLEHCGYTSKIWVIPFLRPAKSVAVRMVYALCSLPGLKQIFGAEIFAIARSR
ncbi:TPA: class I SAM-dependent methyltransferase [Candidatus Woesearchaeota archaeon]|nr:MAG: Methyltransferase type 11 [Parcubacteria group bacterium GW2011_GWF2_50_9]HIH24096.1 class I SAM-dependent methyltransferase [Candidatus Woesearchaeota archaeon]